MPNVPAENPAVNEAEWTNRKIQISISENLRNIKLPLIQRISNLRSEAVTMHPN